MRQYIVCASILGVAMPLACSVGDDAPPGQQQHTIVNPTATQHPPWASELTWGKEQVGHEHCTASLVRKGIVGQSSWALTAAHCFRQFAPLGSVGTTFGSSFSSEDVHFLPGAYGSAEKLSDLDPNISPGTPGSATPPATHLDYALVRIELGSNNIDDYAAIKLWYPLDGTSAATWLVGKTVTFAGLQCSGGLNATCSPAVGEADVTSVPMPWLRTTWGSGFQTGDSGGGMWLTLGGSEPVSNTSFGSACTVQPALTGDVALIGVNRATDPGVYNEASATFAPKVANWIANITQSDDDGDGVCNDVDNCTDLPNPGQENANRHAEEGWGHDTEGQPIHLGDVCDPAPTPLPQADLSAFVVDTTEVGYQGNYLVTTKHGRDVRDDVTIQPVLDDGSSLQNDDATARFCDCRDAALQPLDEQAICTSVMGGHRCLLDPRQADDPTFQEVQAGQASIAGKKTAWHPIRIEQPAPQPSQKLAPYTLDYPGPGLTQRWDYQADYAEWVTQNSWMTPAQPAGVFGSGTDLGGMLWGHSLTDRGKEAHGLDKFFCDPALELCSIADGFRLGVAVDERTTRVTNVQLLVDGHGPLLPSCPPACPLLDVSGQSVINPAPFVAATFGGKVMQWDVPGSPQLGAKDVSDGMFSDDVQAALGQQTTSGDSARLIGASEPAVELTTAAEADTPRALLLESVGGGSAQVRLKSVTLQADGSFGTRVLDSPDSVLGASLHDALNNADVEEQPLALAYGRSAQALYLLHQDASGTVFLTGRQAISGDLNSGSWWQQEISLPGGLGAQPWLMWSSLDWHLWLAARGSNDWQLRRMLPSDQLGYSQAGELASDIAFGESNDYSQVWLAGFSPSQVVLAANLDGGGYRLALLSLDGSAFGQAVTIRLDGVYEGSGQLMLPPQVARGAISVLVQQTPLNGEEDGRRLLGVTTADFNGSWAELADGLAGQ